MLENTMARKKKPHILLDNSQSIDKYYDCQVYINQI